MRINTKFLFTGLLLAFAVGAVGLTVANYQDSETSNGNIIAAGTWTTPGPEPEPGDIVINEVMWMGSKDIDNPDDDGSLDQWIELKNVSNRDLHKKGLYITSKPDVGSDITIFTITNQGVIPAGESYLTTHYAKNRSALNVSPSADGSDMDNFQYGRMQLQLWYQPNILIPPVLIDEAGDGINPPSDGDAVNFYSMQRNLVPGDGTDYANWFTCTDPSTTATYWDAGRVERGTPGGPNV